MSKVQTEARKFDVELPKNVPGGSQPSQNAEIADVNEPSGAGNVTADVDGKLAESWPSTLPGQFDAGHAVVGVVLPDDNEISQHSLTDTPAVKAQAILVKSGNVTNVGSVQQQSAAPDYPLVRCSKRIVWEKVVAEDGQVTYRNAQTKIVGNDIKDPVPMTEKQEKIWRKLQTTR